MFLIFPEIEKSKNRFFSRTLLQKGLFLKKISQIKRSLKQTFKHLHYYYIESLAYSVYHFLYLSQHFLDEICFIYGVTYNTNWVDENNSIVVYPYTSDNLSYNSPYIKVKSIGCWGCDKLRNITCNYTSTYYPHDVSNEVVNGASDKAAWMGSMGSSMSVGSYNTSSIRDLFDNQALQEVYCKFEHFLAFFETKKVSHSDFSTFTAYPQTFLVL